MGTPPSFPWPVTNYPRVSGRDLTDSEFVSMQHPTGLLGDFRVAREKPTQSQLG